MDEKTSGGLQAVLEDRHGHPKRSNADDRTYGIAVLWLREGVAGRAHV